MHFDSIKSRLVLMTLICVIGMAMLMGNQHYFTQQLVSLNQQRDVLLRLNTDLLQMRRHEKDFLLRHQLSYVTRFNHRAEQFSVRLTEFSAFFAEYDEQTGAIGNLAQAINAYEQGFESVVSLQNQIGLSESEGLQGEANALASQLSRLPTFDSNKSAKSVLLEAKLAEQSFIATRDTQYREIFSTRLNELIQIVESGNSESAIHLLAQYELNFTQLSDALVEMGLSHNEGLRGQFRRQAHDVEEQLESIDKALQPIIEEQERTVQLYSLMIAALTSIVLVLVLVKSFATFHRAFSNFVMFFYRCKRQYQKIDPKQLGFSEFKSLAELANEMVESRKVIEQRLATAEAKLQALQQDNNGDNIADSN